MAYRLVDPDEPAREVAFRELTPATHQRLADACEGRVGAPLLSAPSRLGGLVRWWRRLALGAALGAVACLLAGFGSLSDGPRHLGYPARAGVMLGAALAAFCARQARGFARRPFRPGVYLFARELIDARGSLLRLVPTASLRGMRRVGQGIELHFAGGERHSFGLSLAPSHVERTLAAHHDALRFAEEKGDTNALAQLDPLCDERSRWAEAPPPAPSARRALAASAASAAAALLLGASLGLLAALESDPISDLVGVELAHGFDLRGSLWSFLKQGGARSLWGSRASEALLDLELRDQPMSLEVLAERFATAPLVFEPSRDPIDQRLHAFVHTAVGPARERVDNALFNAAVESQNELSLSRYAAVGSRAEVVRRLHLPRHQLIVATALRDAAALLRLRDAPIDEGIRAEAGQELQKLVAEARERFASATGLRTPLARAIHDELGHASERRIMLLLADPNQSGAARCPGGYSGASSDSVVLVDELLRAFLEPHVMPIRLVPRQPPGLRDVPEHAARLEVSACTELWRKTHLGQPDPILTTQLSLTFAGGDGTAAAPVQLQFRSLGYNPDPKANPASPPGFDDAARKALRAALVGEPASLTPQPPLQLRGEGEERERK